MFWYLQVLKKYAVFSGRARRREYWMFTLVNALITSVLSIPMLLTQDQGIASAVSLVLFAYGLATFVPTLAVCVRRLHDTGRGGWWYLIGGVPIVGAILIFVWFVTDGDPGENQYGANPKAAFELQLA